MKHINLALIFFISGLIFFLEPKTLCAQNRDFAVSEQEITEKESSAARLAKQWNGEAIRIASELYKDISQYRIQVKDSQKAILSLREASRLKIILGERESAYVLLNQALKIADTSANLTEQTNILSELSILLSEDGKIDESRKLSEKAFAISKVVEDLPALALLNFSVGDLNYWQNNLETSEKFYLQSADLWKKAKNPIGEARTLLSLGYLYLQQNNFTASLQSFSGALTNFQDNNDRRGEAFALIAIATYLSLLNETQDSLAYYQKAEKVFPNDVDYFEQSSLNNGIGTIYEYYGDWETSVQYREKALAGFKKTDNLYGQIATLLSLARLNRLSGKDENALNYYRQSKELALKIKDSFYLAQIEKDLGGFYLKTGNYRVSIEKYENALTYFKQTNAKREIALISNNLAKVYESINEFAVAREFLATAIKLNQDVQNKFAQAESLQNLAHLNMLEGKIDDGIKFSAETIELTETLTTSVANSKLKTTYFSSVFDRYELYINLLMKMHKDSPNENFALQALQAAEKSRARSMLESLSLSEANFTKDANPETVKREKEIRNLLNLKSDKLTDLLSGSAEKAEVEKLDGEIRELENELAEIKATLKQKSPLYSAIKNPAPFDVAEFQRDVLDENTLLLEFSFGKEASFVWLIGKTGFVSYELPPRLQIETKIIKLRELIASREVREGETIEDYQSRIFKADQFYWTEAHQLSNELFGQIADKIAGKRLIIVPDGKLHYFPISALPLPNSASDEPLLFSNETIYESSASTLLLLSKNLNQITADKDLLVFSDPIFTENDSRISAEYKAAVISNAETTSLVNLRFAESLNNLPRLAASRDEGDAAAEIFSASKADIFSGFAATREKVLSPATSDYKIVHFATHGLVNDERPELSGIVLSGFDEKGGKLEQVVRLQDIYGLNLNADLVVLSACQTGVGKEVRGEGLQSLATGFLNVGAKSVVSSLWKVDDNATKELMTHFYKGLAEEKLTTSEALRRAQIKLAQNPRFKAPFYWAAFTLQGDFQNTPKIATGFSYWVYIVLIMPILLILLYGFRKILKNEKAEKL